MTLHQPHLSASVFSSAKLGWQPRRLAGSKGPKEGTLGRLGLPTLAVGPLTAGACGGSRDPGEARVDRSPWQLTFPTFLPAVGHGRSPRLRLRSGSGSGGSTP